MNLLWVHSYPVISELAIMWSRVNVLSGHYNVAWVTQLCFANNCYT